MSEYDDREVDHDDVYKMAARVRALALKAPAAGDDITRIADQLDDLGDAFAAQIGAERLRRAQET